MAEQQQYHDDRDSGSNQQFQEKATRTRTRDAGIKREGSRISYEINEGKNPSTRKRRYQDRVKGEHYRGGGANSVGGGWSSIHTQQQQQPPLNAVYNAARAFVNEGPTAAVEELGSMGLISFTVLVIVLFQYRHPIVNSSRRTRDRLEDMWYYGGGPFGILFDIFGYLRSGFLLALDAVASLRLILPMYGGIDDDDSVGGLGSRRHGDDSSDGGETMGRGRGRRRGLYDRSSGSSQIPELEIVPLPGDSTHSATNISSSEGVEGRNKKAKRPCHLCGIVHTRGGQRLVNGGYCHGIDPAFLNDNEYPAGWLVYDPVYGVIPKELADKKRKVAPAAQSQQEEKMTEEKKEADTD